MRHVLDALDLPGSRLKSVALVVLTIFFVVAGLNHFRDPDFYLAIMPPYLPAHRFLVALTGGLEVAGGVAVLIPRFRTRAGWALVALLVAVFPANLYMAMSPDLFREVPEWALFARLPIQAVLIVWALWATRPAGRNVDGV